MSKATTFHVSVPESMNAFIEQRVKDKNHRTRGMYVQDLIRRDQLLAEKVKLTNMLLTGLASQKIEMSPENWAEMRSGARKKITANNKK